MNNANLKIKQNEKTELATEPFNLEIIREKYNNCIIAYHTPHKCNIIHLYTGWEFLRCAGSQWCIFILCVYNNIRVYCKAVTCKNVFFLYRFRQIKNRCDCEWSTYLTKISKENVFSVIFFFVHWLETNDYNSLFNTCHTFISVGLT